MTIGMKLSLKKIVINIINKIVDYVWGWKNEDR